MENKKKQVLDWIKIHKKQLIIAGISITTLVLLVLGIRNKDALAELYCSLEKNIKKVPGKSTPVDTLPDIAIPTVSAARTYTLPQTSFDVSQHIRTLAEGRQHSAVKAAEAAKLGIVLLPNQTIVDSYTKYTAA